MDFIDKYITEALTALLEAVEKVVTWIYDVVMYIPRLLWDTILDALASFLEQMDVPTWMQNINLSSVISPEMSFFMQGFAIPEGMAIVGAAMLIKFIIRRIPIIG